MLRATVYSQWIDTRKGLSCCNVEAHTRGLTQSQCTMHNSKLNAKQDWDEKNEIDDGSRQGASAAAAPVNV